MPSAMIHMLTARNCYPQGSAALQLGSIAPDYAFQREYKDAIHLRTVPDRAAALRELGQRLPLTEDFALGWLLHLYTDLCWDESHLARYRAAHETEENWFSGYHQALHSAGYALYHAKDWAEPMMREMEALPLDALPLDALPPVLNIDPEALAFFRKILFEKTRESDPAIASAAFSPALTEDFAAETAEGFLRWRQEAGL